MIAWANVCQQDRRMIVNIIQDAVGDNDNCDSWIEIDTPYMDVLVQERRNSSALEMELRLSCTNTSIYLLYHLRHLGKWSLCIRDEELYVVTYRLFYGVLLLLNMMTSSNGNFFRVTGPLCGEFTGPGEFPTQRPVTRSFDVYFDLRPN